MNKEIKWIIFIGALAVMVIFMCNPKIEATAPLGWTKAGGAPFTTSSAPSAGNFNAFGENIDEQLGLQDDRLDVIEVLVDTTTTAVAVTTITATAPATASKSGSTYTIGVDSENWKVTTIETSKITIGSNYITEISTDGYGASNSDNALSSEQAIREMIDYFSTNPTTGAPVAILVRNTSGNTIPPLTAVYYTGETIGLLGLVDVCFSTGVKQSHAIGVTPAAISNNANGLIYVIGEMGGVDTSDWNDGDDLYITSAPVSVGLTNLTETRPSRGYRIHCGTVKKAHATQGTFVVGIEHMEAYIAIGWQESFEMRLGNVDGTSVWLLENWYDVGVVTITDQGNLILKSSMTCEKIIVNTTVDFPADSIDPTDIGSGIMGNDVIVSSVAKGVVSEVQIADNGIDSEHYNDGSIDPAHLATISTFTVGGLINHGDSYTHGDSTSTSYTGTHYGDGSNLTGVAPTASPTFTGTVTLPDGSVFNSSIGTGTFRTKIITEVFNIWRDDDSAYKAINHPYGLTIDGANARAMINLVLPSDCHSVTKIRFLAMAIPAEGDGMRCQALMYAGGMNEDSSTHDVDVTKTSETLNFAAADNIEWEYTSSDDADLTSFTGGDLVFLGLYYSGAVGADIATNCRARGVEITYW